MVNFLAQRLACLAKHAQGCRVYKVIHLKLEFASYSDCGVYVTPTTDEFRARSGR